LGGSWGHSHVDMHPAFFFLCAAHDLLRADRCMVSFGK
jgi:hypothetical protein